MQKQRDFQKAPLQSSINTGHGLISSMRVIKAQTKKLKFFAFLKILFAKEIMLNPDLPEEVSLENTYWKMYFLRFFCFSSHNL